MADALLLVEIGIVPAQVMEWLAGKIEKGLGMAVSSNTPISVPNQAFDQERNQYRGEAILELLAQQPDPNAKMVLGIMEGDCYGAGQEFVLGQAAVGTSTAFVAIHRLRSALYGLREDMTLLRARIYKQSIHELGHAVGLTRCLQRRCIMHCTTSIIEVDLRRSTFCAHCRRKLGEMDTSFSDEGISG